MHEGAATAQPTSQKLPCRHQAKPPGLAPKAPWQYPQTDGPNRYFGGQKLLHLRGAQSLFEYCQVRLGFSESEAWYRICAARLAGKFPIIFELLERREVHLTALALIAKCLTVENHLELLDQVRGKTKRQILELLARRAPRAEATSHVRKLPRASRAVSMGPTGTLEPLSVSSYRLQLSVRAAPQEKLELARDLMSHANPSGDLAVVVERSLDLLLEKLHARRFGQSKRPCETSGVGRVHAPTQARTPTQTHAQTDAHALPQTPAPASPQASVPPPAHALPQTQTPAVGPSANANGRTRLSANARARGAPQASSHSERRATAGVGSGRSALQLCGVGWAALLRSRLSRAGS